MTVARLSAPAMRENITRSGPIVGVGTVILISGKRIRVTAMVIIWSLREHAGCFSIGVPG